MADNPYERGLNAGHKLGFEAGYQAAMGEVSRKLHVLEHEVHFFPDDQISDQYAKWFGEKATE